MRAGHRALRRALRSAVLCAGAGALLAGCAVGPDYRRPDVATPAAYKENRDWHPARPADALDRGPWWKLFGDPQLDALIAQVNLSNQTLKAAAAQYQQARALVESARSALFPTLGLNAAAARAGGGTATARGGSTGNTVSLAAGASWEPDLWGKLRGAAEAQTRSAQASAAELAAATLSAQGQLAQSYFTLRQVDAERQLYADTIAAFQQSLQLTQNQYVAGFAAQADVVAAQTQLKTAQASAINLGVQRAQLEHAIALLVGQPASNFSIAADPLANVPPPPVPVAGLPSQLLERRPDIAAAERQVAAANAQIGVARAAYFPALTLIGQAGYQGAALAGLISAPNLFWSIGPQLALTLFDGGARDAQNRQARAAYDQQVAQYRQTVLAGFQEVEDALAALRILEQQSTVQDEALAAARESVRLTLNQYKGGVVSYINVISAQATELATARNTVALLGSRYVASVQLVQALGGGWSDTELPNADAVDAGRDSNTAAGSDDGVASDSAHRPAASRSIK
ncbi:MAG: Outer membrane factor (OMF) lipoprotein associated wth MdtABC efflux system [Burkholderiaceae bacterium]|jgi:NodT family efflux transporter outer membrane factor (OMF) lipoprotein|nr:MAG: Outer membrane factor (OMF) lipoprotein associated wth MdtABC efflux system [Burkholderiaceae bacterium]